MAVMVHATLKVRFSMVWNPRLPKISVGSSDDEADGPIPLLSAAIPYIFSPLLQFCSFYKHDPVLACYSTVGADLVFVVIFTKVVGSCPLCDFYTSALFLA